MKKINILLALVFTAFITQAQPIQTSIHVPTKALMDTTVMMVDSESNIDNYTTLHWNKKVYKLDKALIQPLNNFSCADEKEYTTLHWNNKTIRLTKLIASDTNSFYLDQSKYLSVY